MHARNLRDYFQSQGYYDVGVEFRHTPVQNGLVQFYALSMALGLAVFLTFVVFRITR